MEKTSEQLRIEFSKRLAQELKRVGQPISSPTQIAREFNQHFSGQAVTPQTVRKWLLAETMPTQPKLLALAKWLGVSAQWLRYGSEIETAPPANTEVFDGENNGDTPYAKIAPLLDQLLRLSSRDIHIVEGIVQLMHAENNDK